MKISFFMKKLISRAKKVFFEDILEVSIKFYIFNTHIDHFKEEKFHYKALFWNFLRQNFDEKKRQIITKNRPIFKNLGSTLVLGLISSFKRGSGL